MRMWEPAAWNRGIIRRAVCLIPWKKGLQMKIKYLSLIPSLLLIGVTVATASHAVAPLRSGVEKGGYLAPFNPTHVAGPDKGTSMCPV